MPKFRKIIKKDLKEIKSFESDVMDDCKKFITSVGLQVHMSATDKRTIYQILRFLLLLINDLFFVGVLFWISMHVHSMEANGMNPIRLTHESASGATIYICYFACSGTTLLMYIFYHMNHEKENPKEHMGFREAIKNGESKYIRIFNALIYPVVIPFVDGLTSLGLLTYWFTPHNHNADGSHPFSESFMYVLCTISIILNLVAILIQTFVHLPGSPVRLGDMLVKDVKSLNEFSIQNEYTWKYFKEHKESKVPMFNYSTDMKKERPPRNHTHYFELIGSRYQFLVKDVLIVSIEIFLRSAIYIWIILFVSSQKKHGYNLNYFPNFNTQTILLWLPWFVTGFISLVIFCSHAWQTLRNRALKQALSKFKDHPGLLSMIMLSFFQSVRLCIGGMYVLFFSRCWLNNINQGSSMCENSAKVKVMDILACLFVFKIFTQLYGMYFLHVSNYTIFKELIGDQMFAPPHRASGVFDPKIEKMLKDNNVVVKKNPRAIKKLGEEGSEEDELKIDEETGLLEGKNEDEIDSDSEIE